ncbi:cobalt transport protein CbiM [Bryobacterales bacterium F-183]|nr:cobalt transport protein CbiM [Bryobacterales bacterium F-183]
MHISEGFLPAAHAIGWWLLAAPPLVYSVRRVKSILESNPKSKLELAAVGGFAFALSALKLPSVSGSCSHPVGSGLGAILLGPACMPAIGFAVLLFQALLLAHGGLTTLGANLFSLAIAGPWIAYAVFRLGVTLRLPREGAIFAGAALGGLATYTVTAFQLALAYPASSGGLLTSFWKFLSIFAVTQVPLALSEGLLTVLVLRALEKAQISASIGKEVRV